MDIYLWYSYRAFSIFLQKSEEIFVLQEKYICPLSQVTKVMIFLMQHLKMRFV